MKITYNVWRHLEGKTASQNGSLDLPEFTPNDWTKEAVRNKIRALIHKKHPRWIISGYGIAHKSPTNQEVTP